MPRRLHSAPTFAPLALLCACLLLCSPALAADKGKVSGPSAAALALRKSGDLIAFEPAEGVSGSYFVTDEAGAKVIFGPVREFVQSRNCPVAWLIESGEKARLAKVAGQSAAVEYTLVMEEDCPGRVAQYSFVFLTSTDPKAWLAWREQFHKSKTTGHYGEALKRLAKAAADGFPVSGDLRFVAVNGELALRPVEELLRSDKLARPVYDLVAGRALAR